MIYISIYKKSNRLRQIFSIMVGLVFIVPAVFIVLPPLFTGTPVPREKIESLLVILGACLLAAAIMQTVLRRLVATVLEVTETGLRHLAPGRERIILWRDVISAKKVPHGKGQVALRIRTKSERYLFPPHLVPDSSDAPALRFGFPWAYWLYPDGHRERADFEHSFAYKIMQQYRPDLLTGRLTPKQ